MEDYFPGDPARHVLGREDEKSARRHRPLPPKPKILSFEEKLSYDIRKRMFLIAPAVSEASRLEEALKRLERV